MFLSRDTYWKTYALENLLYLKHLHNRGFKIDRSIDLNDSIFSEFLLLMFGPENIYWEPLDTQNEINEPEYENLNDEEKETYFMLQDYYERDHYLITIKLTDYGTLSTDQYNTLLSIVKVACVSDETMEVEGVFPWYELFKSVQLLEEDSAVTGLQIHMVDYNYSQGDEPLSLSGYLAVFIRLWDQLQVYKQGVP